jgi:hypothetical protein
MLVRNIAEKREGDEYRVQADVDFETRDARQVVHFSVHRDQADWIRPEPHCGVFRVGERCFSP